MRINYEDYDEEYKDTPRTMKMCRVRDDEHRVREKANKPPRRDKWAGVTIVSREEE